jgi:hypothetical protein
MFTYDFIPQMATGKNKIVKFKSSKRNKQNGGQLDEAQFGMEKGDTYDPYGAKAAQSQQYVNMMNQYQNNKAQNKTNMYSDLSGALQQNFMMDNANKLKSFLNRSVLNKQQLDDMNRFAPKYIMDSNTGAVTIEEPDYKTDPTQMSNGGYVNHNNMYYAQTGMEVPRQEDFPDYNSYAAAMQEWQAMGEYNNYMNPASMMADSIPMAQPLVGVPPVQSAVVPQAAQYALNPYQGTSVQDFLVAQNKAGDYTSRKALANQLGISNYRGTAAQNLQMMAMLNQNPEALKSYSPSTGGGSKTTTVIDQQGNPVQVPVVAPNPSKDTTASKKVTMLPKKQANESESSYVSKVLALVGATAAAGGLTYLESQAMLKHINSGGLNISGAGKAKLLEGITALTNKTATGATESIKGVASWFKGLPKRQKDILRALDIAEIPGGLAGTRPGTAGKTLDTWKMLQEARAEGSFLSDAEAANAIAEAEAEAKALRTFNAQKAAAARWGKPMPTFPKLGGAPAAAEEASGVMNALKEARLAMQETPWIRNTARFLRKMPKFQEGGEPDSMGENILEWIDPTGVSSWDDVYRSWNDPNAAWWETGLEMAGAIPVFGKFGKGAKALGAAADVAKGAKEVNTLSKAGKAWKGTKKVVGTGLDWVGGSAPQRFIDQSINPLTRGMGTVVAKGVNNSPKAVQYLARGIQPFQQGQRFWKGVGDVTGQGLGTAGVPQPVNEQINIMMPNGQIVPMSTQDPELLNLVNQGMIDTAQFTGYEPNTNSWRAKKGIKYKGKTYKSGGSTFSGNAWYRDGGTNNPGFRALPDFVQHQILSNMAYGGIQIDPAKRGTFKAQATRMGMGVQEAASAILNAPEGKYSPAMRKKANFAKNFAKQDGGPVEGEIMDVSPEQLEALRQQGYQFEIM